MTWATRAGPCLLCSIVWMHAFEWQPIGCLIQCSRRGLQVKAQAEAEGKLLPKWHPSVKAVQRVGMRIAAVAGDGHGGGYQEHMKVGPCS